MKDGHRPSVLCIEDPLTPGNDIGRGSYGALQVRQSFEYAYLALSQGINPLNYPAICAGRAGILGRIIRIRDRVVSYRDWVKAHFSSLTPTGASPISSDSDSDFSDPVAVPSTQKSTTPTPTSTPPTVPSPQQNQPPPPPKRPQQTIQFTNQNGFLRLFNNRKRSNQRHKSKLS